ncbi:hypothetical protein [Gimesia fumaroli]|uniref:MraY-like glycosyltransferase n=1 Tax=Gimesia fumaroli TaxID=2527976 RepID=A0A518I4K8_9PLAN|nr:hypothetical protein [Gimesia fumaroli]QDV48007.1 hypothetical protein Enr17x_00160 [Gimesia fumaroli]
MAPDEFQQAWQAQSAQTRVTIDADLLRQEVQRNQLNFRAMIFYRDFGEVLVALLLIPVWFILGARTSSPWTWYLTVPVLIWMAGFMLVYRIRHRQKPSEPDEPLLHCVQRSLTEVEDQIWLLRNIFWWYILPPSVSILAFFAQISWLSRSAGWLPALISFAVLAGSLLALNVFIYFLNQRAVRLQLEPRRQELLTLLSSLEDETTGDGTGKQIPLPGLPFAEKRLQPPCASPTRLIIGLVAFALIMLFLVFMIVKQKQREEYPKLSPFAAVRWQEAQPEVKLGEEWFKLIALDGLPTAEIVEFSKQTYGDKWQKRFEEDLVELLTRMGHPPNDKVTLEVQSLNSSEKQIRKDVPMTKENRSAIYKAARKQNNSEP